MRGMMLREDGSPTCGLQGCRCATSSWCSTMQTGACPARASSSRRVRSPRCTPSSTRCVAGHASASSIRTAGVTSVRRQKQTQGRTSTSRDRSLACSRRLVSVTSLRTHRRREGAASAASRLRGCKQVPREALRRRLQPAVHRPAAADRERLRAERGRRPDDAFIDTARPRRATGHRPLRRAGNCSSRVEGPRHFMRCPVIVHGLLDGMFGVNHQGRLLARSGIDGQLAIPSRRKVQQ